MSAKPVSPLLLERYELKYLIPMDMVETISKAIEGHCELDHFSAIAPDKFYTINSLYFDTPEYKFLVDKKNGAEPSYGFRIRSYSDNPKPPFYAEIKFKQNDFSNKLRAMIPGVDWAECIRTGEIPEGLDPVSHRYLERFLRAVLIYDMSPKVLTQYRRKAYFSTIDEYARITFDRDMRFQHETDFNLIPDDKRMCHYDHSGFFDPNVDESCVVLELKAEKRIPVWMIDLIKRFELTRDSFSKYASSILTQQELLDSASKDFHPSFRRDDLVGW